MRGKGRFAAFLVCVFALSALVMAQPAQAATVTLSAQYDICWITSSTHQYFVQQDVWNGPSGWVQTMTVNDQTGAFTIASSNAAMSTSGSPMSYPSIVKGNHWGTNTQSSGMPCPVTSSVSVSWSFSTVSSGAYDCALDIWIEQTNTVPGSTPNGQEIMVWPNYLGSIQPAGSQVTTATIAGASWQVWHASGASPPITSYRAASKTTSLSINVANFCNDAISRGYIQSSYYILSVEAGFELWTGGAGLASNSYSVSVSGAPPVTTTTTTPPTTTTTTPPSGGTVTYNGVTYTVITAPFSFNGAGTFNWATTTMGKDFNSWNLASLTVNSVDYTNKWVQGDQWPYGNTLPAKINGYYFIHYVGNYAWSHFEINTS